MSNIPNHVDIIRDIATLQAGQSAADERAKMVERTLVEQLNDLRKTIETGFTKVDKELADIKSHIQVTDLATAKQSGANSVMMYVAGAVGAIVMTALNWIVAHFWR